MYTELHYMYRDAANYKQGHTVYFEGAITSDQTGSLRAKLDDGLYFIPGDVGLEELQPRMTSFPGEDDHVWHELLEINTLEDLPHEVIVQGPVCELVKAFDKIKSSNDWDVGQAMIRLDITA